MHHGSLPMDSFWTDRLSSRLHEWLAPVLGREDLLVLVPPGDPLRTWWTPDEDDLRLDVLLDVIRGSQDDLMLMALVQYARGKSGSPAPDGEVEAALTARLVELSIRERRSHRPAEFHAFLSYSHRDSVRAQSVVAILREGGMQVFRDVEQINPGESITGRLHEAMSHIPRAILLISRDYLASRWTDHELQLLSQRKHAAGVVLLPVLLDDVPLPPSIADVFTVDLRGFEGGPDREWAKDRLQGIIRSCVGSE